MTQSELELMRYHDGESDPDERRRVEARLLSDDDARAYLASLGASSRAVRRWSEQATNADIADAVMSRIERDEAANRHKVIRLRRVSWSLLASGLAAAACLWFWVGSARVEVEGPRPGHLPAAAPVAPRPQPVAGLDNGVAIEKLDFGANSGSIFVVQGSSEATPVVWLSDSEGDRAKMEPL